MNISVDTCPICGTNKLNDYLTVADHSVSHETFSIRQCKTCTLLITTPRPQNLDSYYASTQYISHAQTASSLFEKIYFAVRSRTLKQKLKLAEHYHTQRNPKSVLDYGCGTGEFLRTMLHAGWSVTGVEPSPQARQASQSDIKPNIYASESNLPEETFSLITLWHVLEHTDNPLATLQQLRTRMKPGAHIFIAVPNPAAYDTTRYKAHWAGYDVPRHLWHFTPASMKTLIKEARLTLVAQKPMPFDAYYVSLLSEQYRHENKHTITGIIRAAYIATLSNIKATITGDYSSLLYIARND